MNDELDVLSRLVAYHDHIEVPAAAVADDVRRGRQRVRRTRALATGGIAAGVAAIVTTTALVVTAGESDTAPPPIAPTPTETVTDPAQVDRPRNGRIVRADRHLPPGAPACATCSDVGFLKAYDAVSDRALWAFYDLADLADGSTQLGALSVVGPDGELSSLGCPDNFACRPLDDLWSSGATLGPGPDQLTVEADDQTLHVIRYDGSDRPSSHPARRTLDLTTVLGQGENIDTLAWSPDRSRLAVLTSALAGGEAKIWLVDRDGGRATLVHTSADVAQLTYLSDLSWSPDGTRLGFVEEYTRFAASGGEVPVLTRAVAVDVPEAGGSGPGTAATLYEYELGTLYATSIEDQITGGVFLWSPDGARAAVLDGDEIIELSADDGTVLARHPTDRLRSREDVGWLVWPARRP